MTSLAAKLTMASARDVACEYIGRQQSASTNPFSYNFTIPSAGLVVAGLVAEGSRSLALSSCSIGGVSATQAVGREVDTGGGVVFAYLFYRYVAAGGLIAVSGTGAVTPTRATIAVWHITGAFQNAPRSSQATNTTSSSAALSLTLSGSRGAVAIGLYGDDGSDVLKTTLNAAWTQITEDFEGIFTPGSSSMSFAGAHGNMTSTSISPTVQTTSTDVDKIFVGAVWR